MFKKLKKQSEGFTIIEVLIVLAIAGLIMLIVFLAVPALQRNQRNTSRRSDASRIGSAATNYATNNNGNLPPVATAASGTSILADAGTLSQYSGLVGGTAVVMTAGQVNVTSGAKALTNVAAGSDAVLIDEAAQCGATTGVTIAGTARQMAMLYTLEAGSGANATQACLNL